MLAAATILSLRAAAEPKSECDAEFPDRCSTPLEIGDPAPYAGQLLTPSLAVHLGQAVDKCEDRAALDLQNATAAAEIELTFVRKRAQIDLYAATSSATLWKSAFDRLAADTAPTWLDSVLDVLSEPIVVAVLTAVATTAIFVGVQETVRASVGAYPLVGCGWEAIGDERGDDEVRRRRTAGDRRDVDLQPLVGLYVLVEADLSARVCCTASCDRRWGTGDLDRIAVQGDRRTATTAASCRDRCAKTHYGRWARDQHAGLYAGSGVPIRPNVELADSRATVASSVVGKLTWIGRSEFAHATVVAQV